MGSKPLFPPLPFPVNLCILPYMRKIKNLLLLLSIATEARF